MSSFHSSWQPIFCIPVSLANVPVSTQATILHSSSPIQPTSIYKYASAQAFSHVVSTHVPPLYWEQSKNARDRPPSGSSEPMWFIQRSSMAKLFKINWDNYNITYLVDTCDSVCLLVFGAGNPDISGIGVMNSYLIQGLSTIILGPVLASVVLIRSKRLSNSKDTFFNLDPAFLQNQGP
ncbi:hypothetical protein B0H63DRAFT_89004 [Podospora didyma]|uniref:Uncharacterized protein n=1 Tax=Podospora didyma TaxID=330526 RepID=A0AAE0K106_9PEZI|nr:hypothetical protein B0H63DRAFT_89004 [Podospora didyma]